MSQTIDVKRYEELARQKQSVESASRLVLVRI